MFEPRTGGMGDSRLKCGLANSDGNRRASDLKPRQGDFHHGLEPTALSGQSCIRVDMTIANKHRAACISAEADPVPTSSRIETGSALFNEIKSGVRGALRIDGL